MCRWFAYISPNEPCLLSDVLIAPANSISKQCSEHYLPKLLPHHKDKDLDHSSDELVRMRNSLLNMDGLGIAWYTDASSSYLSHTTGRRPALYKSQSPPINDFNFTSLCSNTESHCVFAHIRASSGSAVTPVNSHPFVFGRHTYMHNGMISNFSAIRRDLTDLLSFEAYCNIFGSTDSEHAAALYMTNLTAGQGGGTEGWEKEYPIEEMCSALKKTIIQILELQHKRLGEANTPNSLNFCTTSGTKLVAVRFRNHATQQPPSLYWSEFAGKKLNSKFPGSPDDEDAVNDQAVMGEEDRIGKHTIVASEPTTYDEKEWHLIERNHALMVGEDGVEKLVKIEYDEKLNAKDPKFD